MERLENNESWSLFDPLDAGNLVHLAGDDFKHAYIAHEEAMQAKYTLPARQLWHLIVDAQRETGTPFLLYSDNINRAYHIS